jgi:hypothetical protein
MMKPHGSGGGSKVQDRQQKESVETDPTEYNSLDLGTELDTIVMSSLPSELMLTDFKNQINNSEDTAIEQTTNKLVSISKVENKAIGLANNMNNHSNRNINTITRQSAIEEHSTNSVGSSALSATEVELTLMQVCS